jgi:hypothetical protein
VKQQVMTIEEYRAHQAAGGKGIVGANKYGSMIMEHEGQRYHSKAELRMEMHLRLLRALGKVAWWTRQVPFALAPDVLTGRVKFYRLDFLVQMAAPVPARLVEVKGKMTGEASSKLAWVQSKYGVVIEVVSNRGKEIEHWS